MMCDHHDEPELTPAEADAKARREAQQARDLGLDKLAATILRDAGLDPES